MTAFEKALQKARAERRTYPALFAKWKDVPIGTDVIVTRDLGEKFATKTRSEPWLTGDGTPMIKVEGITGGYLLSRLKLAVPGGETR